MYPHIHAVVDSNYQLAINRYNSQKNAFLITLGKTTEKLQRDFIDQLNQEIKNELNQGEISSEFDKIFSEIEDVITELYANFLLYGNNFSNNNILNIIEQKKTTGKNFNPTSYYNRVKNDIDKFLASNISMRRYIENILKNNNLNPSGNNMQTIVNQFNGYARRVFFNKAIGTSAIVSTQKYKQSLKGYYREELIIKALSNLFKDSNFKAVGSGSLLNQLGHQINMDIFIGRVTSQGENPLEFLQNNLIQIPEGEAKATVELGYPSNIGVQSKSWIEPWIDKKPIGSNSNYLAMGHHANLLNSLAPDGLFNWHEGVMLASQNINQIIGVNNVLFSTGSGIKWTADLISEFRSQNYYLAFYISKVTHKATGSVVWEQEIS